LNPACASQIVSFIITVVPVNSNATPTGTVILTDNGTIVGTATLNSFGQASIAETFTSPGTHIMVATYSGDATFAPGVSAPLTEVITACGADLSIKKTGSPNPVVSGSQLTYTISVTNNGPQDATGVTVTDSLPATVHFNSMSSSQGTCTRSTTTKPSSKDGTVTCKLGSLSNGGSATVTIVVTATKPRTLSNTASVTGDQPDPTSADNSSTATTTVVGG
jgi:uncharacterized repeat protein (TIGR01451 family)